MCRKLCDTVHVIGLQGGWEGDGRKDGREMGGGMGDGRGVVKDPGTQ